MFAGLQDKLYSNIGNTYYQNVKDYPRARIHSLIGKGHAQNNVNFCLDLFLQRKSLEEKEQSSSLKKLGNAIKVRLEYLAAIPLSFSSSLADGVIAIPMSLPTLLAAGSLKRLNSNTYFQLRSFSRLLSAPFEDFVHCFNPGAQFRNADETSDSISSDLDQVPYFQTAENPRSHFFEIISRIQTQGQESENWAVKHLATRGLYLLSGIVATVAQVVAFPFGLIAAAFSILTFGTIPRLNEAASKGLKITNVASIVYLTVLGLITAKPLYEEPNEI